MLLPVPTKVPPQVPRYHFHTAPVPSEPPTTVSITELPETMLALGVTLIEVAATLGVLIVRLRTAILSQPAALTVWNWYTPDAV